jgi:hypothetical protein
VTRLRKLMLEELQRRNYSEATIRGYLRVVAAFAKHFGKPPDKLGPEELRPNTRYFCFARKSLRHAVYKRASRLCASCT